jgi:hypothetical protein
MIDPVLWNISKPKEKKTMKVPDWILRLVGKAIAKKLNLEDKQMDNSPTKKWYQSKSIWNAIVIFLIGAYALVQSSLAPAFGWTLPNIPEWLLTILGAIGVYTRATATSKIG